jgi:redox-sensing transcriptional repressor
VRVFSENLADAAGVTATQVRKDFSIFGITGNRRGGYKVDELIEQLNKILGKDKIQKFILIGMGNLGKALIQYAGFERSGIKIVAGFDIDANKWDREGAIPIYPMDELTDVVRKQGIEFGIITVPDFAAQQVLELMIPAGIRGVLNFAPICVKGPEGCVVNNINLVTELENIIYFVNATAKTNESEK